MGFLAAFLRWFRFYFRPRRQTHFEWRIGPVSNKKTRYTMDITLTNEQQVKVTLKPVTGAGKPAQLDGPPVWTVVSGDCKLQVADDGLSADIISGDLPGDTEITISADADLGAGVVNISDALRVTVNGAMAQSLGIEVGTPTNKP